MGVVLLFRVVRYISWFGGGGGGWFSGIRDWYEIRMFYISVCVCRGAGLREEGEV